MQSSTIELKQVRNFLDTSLKAHLEAKGALCLCCEQPRDLCRCVSRANRIRLVFQPMKLRAIDGR